MNNSPSIKLSVAWTVLLFLAGLSPAQTATPLGLPRLKDEVPAGDATPLARTKFAETDLAREGGVGARAGEKGGTRFLSLDGGKEWSRPLRGRPGDVLFVSFSLYGSTGTIVEFGGARVGVVESDIDNYAQLAVDEPAANGLRWRMLGVQVPLERHEGKLLGAFTVLTARLDPGNGTFDLYQGTRMVAEDLPLLPAGRTSQFVVRAGPAGAMLNGLVQADENPLYEDANRNGIDDRFENKRKGRLLAAGDTPADRRELIEQWRRSQLSSPPPALFFARPLPDGK